jgi:ABC-2 type transport system ATP-binding protein
VGSVPPASGRVAAPDRHRIGFMPTGSGVWRDLSVDENLEFVGGAYGLKGAALAARRDVLLEATGLSAARDRLASRLSGGMRQKLAFAAAVLHEPALLVLDEPSTGVDPVSRVELWRLMAQAAAAGTAVILSTSYLDEAERAGFVLVLHAGRTLLHGPPAEVIAAAPGHVTRTAQPTRPDRAWRRGRAVHQWHPEPDTTGAAGDEVVDRDMEDAVISAALADEERRG